MIISHENKFAFVHIPKCAGTTIRSALINFDDTGGQIYQGIESHRDIGLLDYTHIPLQTLSDYFPEEYNALLEYWSFAVLRDPYLRFGSSVTQRLKKNSEKPLQHLSEAEINACVSEIIERLMSTSKKGNRLPPDLIHFQPQIDFIFLQNKQVVKSLYTLEGLPNLYRDFQQRFGNNPFANKSNGEASHSNKAIVHRNSLVQFVTRKASPVSRQLKPLMSHHVRKKLQNFLYVSRDERYGHVFQRKTIRDFIGEYYKHDIQLYGSLKSRGEKL